MTSPLRAEFTLPLHGIPVLVSGYFEDGIFYLELLSPAIALNQSDFSAIDRRAQEELNS